MKKNMKYLSALILALIIPVTVFAKPAVTGKPTPPPPSSGKVIILDAGHGGSDSGAVNPTYGLVERDLNLEIALQTKAILNAGGYTEVYLTRTDNTTNLDNNARYTFANNKGGNLLVSIHLNSFTDPNVDGTQTMYGKQTKDMAFAKLMQQQLFGYLNSTTIKLSDRGVSQFASGVLLKSNMPSVITESVFMSNKDEAQALADGTRQSDIAQGIASGINGWFNK
jgi:N-acetylmuramoyl-L-alanine amidase